MTTLEVLIGLPASGKSSYAIAKKVRNNNVVLSSDEIRKELNITTYTKEDNEKVFSTLHDRLFEELSKENNYVVYDATNLSKKRFTILQEVRRRFKDVFIKYTFFKVDIATCIKRDSLREEGKRVGEKVIIDLLKSFTGFYNDQRLELFDSFTILNGTDKKAVEKEFYIADKCKQDNVFHTNTVGQHIKQVYKRIKGQTTDKRLLSAASYHDIGKIYTKQFKNAKGTPTKNAHFYRHEKVSSYIYTVNNFNFKFFYCHEKIEELYVQALIEKHMVNKLDCKKNKILNLYFNKKYNLDFAKDLKLLNECDKYRKWYQKIIIKLKKKVIGTK